MFQAFFRAQARLSTVQWVTIAIVAALFNFWATRELNAAYSASGFPVPYWVAQLSFDHLKLKVWYQTLIEHQQLGLYLHAQYVDFAFIASVLVLHVSALVVVSRLHPESSRFGIVMLWAALLSSLAPLFDALENMISFVMLANPMTFEPFLAVVYSSLAAAKFGMFTFAYVAATLGLIWAMYVGFRRLRRRSEAA